MWVRSLSLPPPHPLVLTGKGRSFLQPKLPTLPLRPFPLCVCFFFCHNIGKWGSLLLSLQFCGGLLHFSLVFFLVFVQFCGWSGGSAQLHFLHRHCVLVNWVVSFAVICMVLCISNLGYVHTHGSHYTTYTLTGCYSSPSLHERPLKITKRCVLLPWCPTLLQSSCPSLHIQSSLWWLVTPMLPLCVCVH